jgi:hypothetical protein
VRDTAAGVSASRRAAATIEPASAISTNAGSQFQTCLRRLASTSAPDREGVVERRRRRGQLVDLDGGDPGERRPAPAPRDERRHPVAGPAASSATAPSGWFSTQPARPSRRASCAVAAR